MDEWVLIYNQADLHCSDGSCCPVAHHNPRTNQVRVSDPDKPENGFFIFSSPEEYNEFLEHATRLP